MTLVILDFLDLKKYSLSTFLLIRGKHKQTICILKLQLNDG